MKEKRTANSIIFFMKLSFIAFIISGCSLVLFKDPRIYQFLEKIFLALCIMNGLSVLIIIIGAYYIVKKEISNGSKDNNK